MSKKSEIPEKVLQRQVTEKAVLKCIMKTKISGLLKK